MTAEQFTRTPQKPTKWAPTRRNSTACVPPPSWWVLFALGVTFAVGSLLGASGVV